MTALPRPATTVFTVMSALAQEHGAVNLGQGFPDEDGPLDLREAAARALVDGPNQYPPMWGVPELRRAVAEHDARFQGLAYDWRDEVLVTSGATEALAAAIMALVRPGDEVVLFEPLYDSYLPVIRRCGGVPRFVRLEPPRWEVPEQALAAAFSPRTRLVLLNTPMNPTGKVFTCEELSRIAAHVLAGDACLLCDEVYEHLVFGAARHVSPAALPGWRDRTLRIGSAGKTFSLTGWKVGYVSGPRALVAQVAGMHQFLTFTTPPNLQVAVALGLRKDDGYYAGLRDDLAAKRDRLGAGLARLGFDVLPADGTYFLTAAWPAGPGVPETDEDYSGWLTRTAKVTPIPCSAFYAAPNPPRHLVRFCFCKRFEVLDEALARLERTLARAIAFGR